MTDGARPLQPWEYEATVAPDTCHPGVYVVTERGNWPGGAERHDLPVLLHDETRTVVVLSTSSGPVCLHCAWQDCRHAAVVKKYQEEACRCKG